MTPFASCGNAGACSVIVMYHAHFFVVLPKPVPDCIAFGLFGGTCEKAS